MKIITFNALNLQNPPYKSEYHSTLETSSDFEYFKNIHLKSHRNKGGLAWWSYDYTIDDEHAEFLKIKYPGAVNIKERLNGRR